MIRKMPTPLPLREGQRLKQPEFHRLYEACPPHVKAELVGGIVYMPSPLGQPHGTYHIELGGVFWLYKSETPGVEGLDNATTILGEESEPQPDLALRILPEFGGRSSDTPDRYVQGAPELLAEIAHSTRDIALNQKRQDYEHAGVLEYVVLCVEEQELHWFDFERGDTIVPNRRGIAKSRAFPGLWIDVFALLAQDTVRLRATAQKGLDGREHAAFVKRLAKRRQA